MEEQMPIVVSKLFESSGDLGKLFLALSKAQGAMRPALKDTKNPFFKANYADLASCWDTARDPLAKNELAVVQLNGYESSMVSVTTVLGHSSGQWIGSKLLLKPVKPDPQGAGSALTYGRRYGLMSITGIAPDDDDGNAASGKHPSNQAITPRPSPPMPAAQNNKGLVTEPQIKRLYAISNSQGWSNDQVKEEIVKRYKVDSSKKLTWVQMNELVDYIQLVKKENKK